MLKDSKTFTSFSVDDLDAAKDFYHKKLGLTLLDEFDGGLRFQTGGDTSFMVYIREKHVPALYTVLNFEVDDIEKKIGELNDQEIMMEQYPEMGTDELGISTQGDDTKMAWFKDPAGNILSLMQIGKKL